MKTINQIKLSLTIGVLIILIPLSGLPQSYKTFMLVMIGAILIYVKVAALHAEKNKKPKKVIVNRRAATFVDSKPSVTNQTQATKETFIVNQEDEPVQ